MAPVLLDGRYRLEGIIGEGGMATVYQAWDERLDRRVAVKLLRPQTTLSEAEAEDFLREARTVARLNHPNVVAVHDAGVADGRPYLVMEFLPGQTLRQRLQAGPLPVTEALRIVRALAGALEAAHAQGILHLDVKPENVLFGEGHDPKLSDFGVSRSLDDVAAPDNGTILGTAAYIAPEVVAGQPPDGRADVYALGVVLYEMVTGQRPFPGGTPVEQAAQRMVTQPILPHLLNPSVPPRLGGILLRALARDPAERYASPTVLCTALEEYENRAEQRTMAISPAKPPALPASRATAPAPIAQRPAAPGPVVPHARVFEAPSRSRAAAPPQKRGCLWLSLWLLVVLVLSGVLGVVLASTVLPDLAGWVTRAGPPLPTAQPTTELPVVVAPSPATASPEPAAAPPTATEALPTATTEPSATAEPTATEEPTPTPEPTETPEPTPEPPPVPTAAPPAVPPVAEGRVVLEDTDWEGGFRRSGDSIYGGRTATWIYGTGSGFDQMTARFDLPDQPSGRAVLLMVGIDGEDRPRTPISITVNGVVIYDDASPFANDDGPSPEAPWTEVQFVLQGLLVEGTNTISMRTHVPGTTNSVPFVMIDYAEVLYETE